MRRRSVAASLTRSALLLGFVLLAGNAEAQEEVVERYDDGSIRVRYRVDEEGHRTGLLERFSPDGALEVRAEYANGELHGRYEEFHRNGATRVDALYRHGTRNGLWREFDEEGRRLIAAGYRDDVLEGRFESFDPETGVHVSASYRSGRLDGRFVETRTADDRVRTASYRDGLLHGTVKITRDGRLLSRQRWVDGELDELDGEKVFPVREAALRETLSAILAPPAADEPGPADATAAERQAALRLLQAYRALCGLPWRELELVPEWNALCDAAAEVCRRNGALSHHPPRPPGIDDDLYERGRIGARNSNLHQGGGMARCVDGFMDDSDPSNIDRVGHRRWCLNPTMRRTGFGESGGFAAMWSMDRSGSAPQGMDAVLYPPPGWVPVDFFGPRHAFSVTLLRGGVPRVERIQVRIQELDEDWVRTGNVLELDHLGVDSAGYGGGPVIVFRPKGLRVEPGARYVTELSTDGGKTVDRRWVVAFTNPIRE